MYNMSTKYRAAVDQISREWDIYIDIVFSNGATKRVDRRSIQLGTAILKEGATCSGTIQVGSTFSNSFECTILNEDNIYSNYDFYGAVLKPYVGLAVDTLGNIEYVPLGKFNILENVRKLSTIPIVSFDDMSRTNKEFDFSTLVFPATCLTVFNAVVEQCGIVATDQLKSEIGSLTYSINSLLTNNPTCRDVLAGFGIMLSKNLRFNRLGQLESFWYTDSSWSTTKSTRVGNSKYSDNQIAISGVYLEDAYGNSFSVGTDEYAIELPTSPIIQGSDLSSVFLSSALTKFQSIAHRPSEVYYIGNPALQAGDIVQHTDSQVGDVSLPIMRLVYKFAGTETLECLGLDEATNRQDSSTDRKLRRAFSKIDSDRSELESKIEQTANSVRIEASETYATKTDQASLEVSVSNITAEVSQQKETVDGVQQALTEVQQNSDSVSIQVQTILENGVDKVVTSMGYSFTDDGLIIQRLGEEIENKIDHTGMYIMRSGVTMLQANNDGVIARDLKAENYLIIGEHTRIEDYNDGEDENRTALFYI